MNIVIIGKRNCPHSVAAMKTARQVMKKKIIRNVTSLYVDTISGRNALRRFQRRIPMSHQTYPIIFANTSRNKSYRFLGGNAEFQAWVRSQ